MKLIDLNRQYQTIAERIDERLRQVLEHGQFIMGPEVFELEQRLADFTGAEHCVTCANGTDALQLALMAVDAGPGDEVITPAFSFFATAEAIRLCGATPVFLDIDPQTFNIDATRLEAAVSRRTRAILPVSLFGQCADMDRINEIALRHDIAVIEDAAQSFGARYKDRKSCALSTIACTSFFPAKPLGCYGDGGACFTSDARLADTLRSCRQHGQGESKYHNVRIGMNSRLDTLQAAILLEKLELLPQEISRRNSIAERYSASLPSAFNAPKIVGQHVSVWAQYCVSSRLRERAIKALTSNEVATAIYYPTPLHLQPAMADLGYEAGDFPHAEAVSAAIFSLPMHPYLSDTEVDRVLEVLHGVDPGQ